MTEIDTAVVTWGHTRGRSSLPSSELAAADPARMLQTSVDVNTRVSSNELASTSLAQQAKMGACTVCVVYGVRRVPKKGDHAARRSLYLQDLQGFCNVRAWPDNLQLVTTSSKAAGVHCNTKHCYIPGSGSGSGMFYIRGRPSTAIGCGTVP
jgi:hypothetical protein